jgi:hypothetical protein
VLERVLDAACGPVVNRRVRVLSASKRLYRAKELWGSEICFVVQRPPPPAQMLRENRHITSAVFWSPTLEMGTVRSLAVLRGSAITKLVILAKLDAQFAGTALWSALKDVPLIHLCIECQTDPPARTRVMHMGPALSAGLVGLAGSAGAAGADAPLFSRRHELVATIPPISLEGLREALPRLRTLGCRRLHCASELRFLREVPLRRLDLASSNLKDLRGIGELPLVVSLNLRSCAKLTSLDDLRGMGLAELDVSYCHGLRNGDISALEGMPLVKLVCRLCATDAHTATIALLGTTLMHLDLARSAVTDAGLFALRWLRPGVLSLRGCQKITAAGIAHLAGMAFSLRVLDLRNTGILAEGCPPELRPVVRVR